MFNVKHSQIFNIIVGSLRNMRVVNKKYSKISQYETFMRPYTETKE